MIRPIRESDFAAFKALRLEALREHPDAFASDHDENTRLPDSQWLTRLRQGIDSADACTFVAEADGELAGMTGVHRESGVKVRHSAFIWGVYVRPRWRGAKLADRFIETCVDWCATQDIRIVRLTVSTHNVAAIRSYLRCGFAVSGVLPEAIRLGDKYIDELTMWRRVG